MGVYGQGEIVAGKIGPKEAAAAGQTLKRLFVFARRRRGETRFPSAADGENGARWQARPD